MSEYAYSFDDLRGDILGVIQSMGAAHQAQQKLDEAMAADLARLWADNAELRDELHALANRVETLTRARLTEPAEVAEQIVSRSRWQACSECGTAIRRGASDGLIYDREGLHTCRESERRIVAGAE